MEITEEQRQRAERNRLAALEKRKVAEATRGNAWNLFKCRKLSSSSQPQTHLNPTTFPKPQPSITSKFRLRLEISSPDSFSITPEPLPSSPYPGEAECLEKLTSWLSFVVPSHYTQCQGGVKATVYKLREYDVVLRCLKKVKDIELQEIPWRTLAVVQKLSHSFVSGCWIPCMPEHLSDDEVDALSKKLPKILLDALLPFQLDGVRYALRRGGRCLIADEMGLGKTIQAIAIACCFMNEGPILVVCPAILRFSWAEEIERWLPICSPTDIHLVFGHEDNPAHLTKSPGVVVISYTMLHRLRKSILAQKWALLIIDESHHVRSSKKAKEPDEIKAVLDVATNIKRKILLTGTPSLSRPGLLGIDKYEFAKIYCEIKYVQGSQGKTFMDFTRGIRLEELNTLLKQTVMIRRLKEHVLVQLPPKRRQIIRLVLKKSDIVAAINASDTRFSERREEFGSVMNGCTPENDADSDVYSEILNDYDDSSSCLSSGQLSYQVLGLAKLSGFREWLSLHPIVTESECGGNLDGDFVSEKMIIFAHHLKVLDGVQAFVFEKGIGFVRIDGNTLARDRQSAVQAFRSSAEIKIAIIGITAGGVGIDFSSAQNVVFLELPQSVSELLQAEDRAHRRGQINAVNVYIFCAKDKSDELRWQNLNKSLRRVSSMMNGKYDSVQELAVDRVSDLGQQRKFSGCDIFKTNANDNVVNEFDEVETIVLKSSSVSQTMQSVKAFEEISGKDVADKVELTVNDGLHLEDMKASDVAMVGGEGYTSEAVRIRSPERTYGNKLDKNDNDMILGRVSLSKEQTSISPSILVHSKLQSENMLSIAFGGDASGPVELVVAEASCLFPPDSLRFEVSQYTGRVHLYICIPGKDLRPRLLYENFHPEELESLNFTDISKKTDENVIKHNPAYKDVLLKFIKEWNNLRPIEQRKLLGKPLQLPLSLELCFLKESMNHGTGGLLKGGSKRRTTPLLEINYPLPENSIWKKISLCSGYRKKEKQYTQGWTATGEPLCKLCQTPCKGMMAKTPEFFEDLFCNLNCFKEFRTRTSQRFLREELFRIEHGVCQMCFLDCHKLVQCIRPLSVSNRLTYIEKEAPKLASHKKIFEKLIKEPIEGNAWHADHITAVHKGGGECSLDNMRTLCVACHKEVTAAQRTEQRITRKNAKKRLEGILQNLKNDGKTEQPNYKVKAVTSKASENLETVVNLAEDELLFNVPGSAYCGRKSSVSERGPENSSDAAEFYVKVPGSACTEGTSMVTESEQKSCSDEDKLLLKESGSVHTECKSVAIERRERSLSNNDELVFKVSDCVYTEGKTMVTESKQRNSTNEDESLIKGPGSVCDDKHTVCESEPRRSFNNNELLFKVIEGRSKTDARKQEEDSCRMSSLSVLYDRLKHQ